LTGQTSELLQDNHLLIGGPVWSPDGEYLAFYDALANGIRILDFAGGKDSVLPSGYGVIGSWSPEGERMVFPVLQAVEGRFSISLHLASLTSQETTVIVNESVNWLDFGLPSWSPDGNWIVVGIQSAEHGLGKQLWLMKSDGSGLHPIVLNPEFTHGGYRWDPYGEKILFQQFNLSDPSAVPEVWLWSMEDEQVQLIAQNAWQPEWLP
jgi:Tol biopolymer transport system component